MVMERNTRAPQGKEATLRSIMMAPKAPALRHRQLTQSSKAGQGGWFGEWLGWVDYKQVVCRQPSLQ